MSYLEKNLLPDEHIIFRTKKNYIIFFVPMVWTVGAVILLFTDLPYMHLFALLFGFVAAFAWANQWLVYVTSEFAVTTKRVVMREGFFIRHVNETRLPTVANIMVNQSLLGQAMNYGTVVLHTFGGEPDAFKEISDPNGFKNKLQEQLEKIIQGRMG